MAGEDRFPSRVTKMCSPHDTNRNRKLLLEAVETGLFSLVNRMVRFCRFRQQSGASPALDEGASPPAK
jgi:hypothetical protein